MADPYFPIPAGLEVPDLAEGETIDFMTTYTVYEGNMTPIAVDGKPIAEAEEAEKEESSSEESFGSAVEKRMQGM